MPKRLSCSCKAYENVKARRCIPSTSGFVIVVPYEFSIIRDLFL